MLRCGKHRDCTFAQVAEDRGYCAWVLRVTADGKRLPRDLRAFCNYIKDRHGGVLCVGKHKHRFFDEVLKDDPDYAAWAATLQNPGSAMRAFSAFVQGPWDTGPRQPLAPKPKPRAKETQQIIPKCSPLQKSIRKRPPRQKNVPQPLTLYIM